MKRIRSGMLSGSAVAVLLLTAGCGYGGDSAGKSGGAAPVADSAKIGSAYDTGGAGYGSDPGTVTAAGAGQLKVRDIPAVGAAVTDGEGRTLYRFDKDTAEPPKSNCDGDCAKAWPPVAADDATAGEGIEAGLLGSVLRADGTRQLTLAGRPVYRYAKDTAAGEALGEGVGGTWHVVGADGNPAAGAPPAEAEKPGAELSVVQNPTLGGILADAEGRTLYRFDKDSAWPMKIGCLDSCLDTWKPAEPVDKASISGIAAELVGSVKRPDGTEQLTIDCWPVYTFTGDKQPGDISGQGKQGLWFAVTDKGKKAKSSV
ncbi:SCO0930 family lipoprotein [Streptomyces sp. NBC_01351]|uniref:SCO0930 family lipoprotein n=1 Tax=Streptomyces sp. NBC_01351 TaxID=2903833 RepID=UPI002E3625BA|nr:SCO0930 family lipoprotein [Streptomyces sp. NBC_01351]